MKQVLSRARRAFCSGGTLLVLLALSSGCGDGDSLASSESPLPPDSTPIDSTPPDTTTPPPVDTTTPPPPPPDTTTPPNPSICAPIDGGPVGAPEHVGLALGPNHVPPPRFRSSAFNGTQITATLYQGVSCLLEDLEAARRANVRVFINFTGNERHLRDENGFSIIKWKQRVDRFRNLDITPYINDGTILAHLIMDEPTDAGNWNGKVVTHEEINEIARYSKEIWPTMPTMIRTWPDYLEGSEFQYLDAIWFHYLYRWGPIDDFIAKHVGNARALGLTVVGGLNVLNGGSPTSGIPGKKQGKNAMSADELREWGAKWLAQPGMCAFLLWEYADWYFSRPDIKAAVDEINAKARAYPKRSCLRN